MVVTVCTIEKGTLAEITTYDRVVVLSNRIWIILQDAFCVPVTRRRGGYCTCVRYGNTSKRGSAPAILYAGLSFRICDSLARRRCIRSARSGSARVANSATRLARISVTCLIFLNASLLGLTQLQQNFIITGGRPSPFPPTMASTSSRHLARSCTSRLYTASTLPYRPAVTTHHQIRHASSKDDPDPSISNPILEEFQRKQALREAATKAQSRGRGGGGAGEALRQQQELQQTLPVGDIDRSSIFEDYRVEARQREHEQAQAAAADAAAPFRARQQLEPAVQRAALDPNPRARERWERRKVVQLITKGGRLSRTEWIARSERAHTVKSHNMKTSVKKLGMLARQITGKTVEDAITQMRFSKKRVAQEVLAQLEAARDEAIVARGMGLGKIKETRPAPLEEGQDEAAAADASTPATETSPTLITTTVGPSVGFRPLDIQLKDGTRHTVTDPAAIYIDQAWVGRGPYGKLPDFRARGRVFLMRTPWTSLSVVLKEEATRIREWREREARRAKKRSADKVWQQLPDRPLRNPRAWYSW